MYPIQCYGGPLDGLVMELRPEFLRYELKLAIPGEPQRVDDDAETTLMPQVAIYTRRTMTSYCYDFKEIV